MVWEKNDELVGHEGARPRRQAQVHRRHRQLQQRGRARPAAAGRAWTCPTTSCPGIANLVKGNFDIQTYYPERAVHAVGEHGAAGPEHQQGADGRRRRSAGRSPLRSTPRRSSRASTAGSVKAANPTGLLPTWDKYVDKAVVDRAGFGFDTAKAKTTAGRRRLQGHQRRRVRRGPGRRPIELNAHRPVRLDRLDGGHPGHRRRAPRRPASRSAPSSPTRGALDDARDSGQVRPGASTTGRGLSNTPWTYYNYMFRLPVQEQQFTRQLRAATRTSRPGTWCSSSTRTPSERPGVSRRSPRQLQRIQLTELPVIPLWYNGLWSQANNDGLDQLAVGRRRRQHPRPVPTTWHNYCARWAASKMLTRAQAGQA